ncbi:MAG: LamG-like jellyroll fold domain-containing protein [Planctomycetota bacterium]
MDETRLRQLSSAHLDGRISDADFAELQQLLQQSASARIEYAEQARMDAELRSASVGSKLQSHQVSGSQSKWTQPLRVLQTLAVTAAVAVLVFRFWDVVGQRVASDKEVSRVVAQPAAEPVRSVAVISAAADAVGRLARQRPLERGVAIEPGRLILDSGLVQLDFFGGATVTLSGPADFEIVNSTLAMLHRGRLRADVPPAARGFEIRTAKVRLEDLGTSFGVVANDDGLSEVVVFDGEVRAIGESGDTVSLYAGDAARLSEGSASKSTLNQNASFPDIDSIIQRTDGREEQRYSQWKVGSEARRRDSRLVAYYDFEGLTDASRRLPNRKVSGRASELDGGIVGASVAQGRWPGKTALDFRGEGDRVRFKIPGEFDALTLYAWVRIDALDRQLNSLFLTDYYDPGEVHWQLSREGCLHVATSPIGVPTDPMKSSKVMWRELNDVNRVFHSDAFWNASHSGQWFFLASSIDRDQASPVAHFVNGRRVGFSSGSNMEKEIPKLRIGAADLGNWTEPMSPIDSIRSLNGRIDEFAIYAAALSADEILQIYTEGKP